MPTLSQVKDILWITDTLQDIQLQGILDSWIAIAQDMVDISAWEKQVWIEKAYIKCNEVYFLSPNVSAITEIDGTDFTTKVVGTDYLLKPNGTAQVLSLSSYISTEFDSYLVKYTAGYVTEPADYVEAIALFCWEKLRVINSSTTWSVTREQLWPREVEYSSLSDDWGTGSKGMTPERKLMVALQKYIPLHLKYW